VRHAAAPATGRSRFSIFREARAARIRGGIKKGKVRAGRPTRARAFGTSRSTAAGANAGFRGVEQGHAERRHGGDLPVAKRTAKVLRDVGTGRGRLGGPAHGPGVGGAPREWGGGGGLVRQGKFMRVVYRRTSILLGGGYSLVEGSTAPLPRHGPSTEAGMRTDANAWVLWGAHIGAAEFRGRAAGKNQIEGAAPVDFLDEAGFERKADPAGTAFMSTRWQGLGSKTRCA